MPRKSSLSPPKYQKSWLVADSLTHANDNSKKRMSMSGVNRAYLKVASGLFQAQCQKSEL